MKAVPRRTTHPVAHLKAARITGNCSTEIDRPATYANSESRRSKNSLVSVSHGLNANDPTIPIRIVANIASPVFHLGRPLRPSNKTTNNVPPKTAPVIYLFPADPIAPKMSISSAEAMMANANAAPSSMGFLVNRNSKFLDASCAAGGIRYCIFCEVYRSSEGCFIEVYRLEVGLGCFFRRFPALVIFDHQASFLVVLARIRRLEVLRLAALTDNEPTRCLIRKGFFNYRVPKASWVHEAQKALFRT